MKWNSANLPESSVAASLLLFSHLKRIKATLASFIGGCTGLAASLQPCKIVLLTIWRSLYGFSLWCTKGGKGWIIPAINPPTNDWLVGSGSLAVELQPLEDFPEVQRCLCRHQAPRGGSNKPIATVQRAILVLLGLLSEVITQL